MSGTVVHTSERPEWVATLTRGGETVEVYVYSGPESHALVHVPTDTFLAAVQSELGVRLVSGDAIVIERSELPEVRDGYARGTGWGQAYMDAHLRADRIAYARAAVLDWAALVQHLTTDEAQVQAVRSVIERVATADWKFSGHEQQDSFLARDIARRLVEHGVHVDGAA